MSIVVIGCVFVDIKGYPSRTYIPGGRNAGKVRYVHGGVSRNSFPWWIPTVPGKMC